VLTVENHTADVPAQRHDGVDIYSLAPGEFQMLDRNTGIVYGCPCGCGEPGVIPFPTSGQKPTWDWNGDVDKPSVAPSIRRLTGCRWHGFLTAGTWKPCGDSGRG